VITYSWRYSIRHSISNSSWYTVQLTGNIARRHLRVPQWSPLRGPNADMPRTRPESNCVDKHQPRKYFYSSARTSQESTCTSTAACTPLYPSTHNLPGLVAPEVALFMFSYCPRLLFWSLHGPQHEQIESPLVWQCGILPGFLTSIIWAWLNKKKMAGDVFLERRL